MCTVASYSVCLTVCLFAWMRQLASQDTPTFPPRVPSSTHVFPPIPLLAHEGVMATSSLFPRASSTTHGSSKDSHPRSDRLGRFGSTPSRLTHRLTCDVCCTKRISRRRARAPSPHDHRRRRGSHLFRREESPAQRNSRAIGRKTCANARFARSEGKVK